MQFAVTRAVLPGCNRFGDRAARAGVHRQTNAARRLVTAGNGGAVGTDSSDRQMASGGPAFFVFGVMLSLPILIAVLNDKASTSRKYDRIAFSVSALPGRA